MKQHWQRIASRVDALSLRERVIVFILAALAVVTLINAAVLEPQFRRQKHLAQQISQDQARIAEVRTQIQQRVGLQAADPDAENRALLQKLVAQSNDMRHALQGLQKSLVPPDKMAGLLESLLKRHGALRLVSLKTLPPAGLDGAAAADQSGSGRDALKGAPPPAQVYRHGVEIVVQGGYLDMIGYMADLEATPWQLLWGQAKLDASGYPAVTLTLTLSTLSMDQRWLNI